MSNFNSAAIEEFKNVWVFCEQRQGKMNPTAFELVSKGRELADELGVKLCGLLIGDDVKGMAKDLGGYGADEVIICESPLLKYYTTDAYAKVICDAIEEMKPEIFLIGATNIGRDLGPRCAARLRTGLCADCTHLDVDTPVYIDFLKENSTLKEDAIERLSGHTMKVLGEDHDTSRDLKMTRPAFGGHLMATIVCPRFRPAMATVRPGVMKKAPFDQAKADAVEVTEFNVQLTESDISTDVKDVVKAAKKLVDLIGADFIVSVGRGIAKDVEGGIALAQELADELGGVVGGSRVAIDSGWLSADHQVGQTGKTVHPKVYVALGISGSIQHKAGMQDSECIIAVNKNPNAPIFEIADYGICGDLFKVTPMLKEAIAQVKANK
ncbi:MAG: electron transfer flavoprotein subunit alpha/FixB family protein [Eubacterium sp.]|nr:electron transfer flavoprotein subunit alpha/FixB family protein [Eubacterium sp.]